MQSLSGVSWGRALLRNHASSETWSRKINSPDWEFSTLASIQGWPDHRYWAMHHRFSIMVFSMSRMSLSLFCFWFVWCFKRFTLSRWQVIYIFFIFIFFSVYELCVHSGCFGSLLACMEFCHLVYVYHLGCSGKLLKCLFSERFVNRFERGNNDMRGRSRTRFICTNCYSWVFVIW